MRKLISYILVLTAILGLAPKGYATDIAVIPNEAVIDESEVIFFDDASVPQLFAAEPPSLDYSKLNGVLTVEVSNYDGASVLLIGEYSADDKLTAAHIITDVKEKNPVAVSGAYEKIFLWNLSDITPQCDSISTKCDYEIVEGVEGEWEVSDDGHILYNYIGSDTEVVIPNSYLGKRIKGVQNDPEINAWKYTSTADIYHYNIFNARTNITSVTVSEGISVIGNFAFASCKNIQGSILLPQTMKIIGAYAYYDCSGFSGDLNLSTLDDIYAYAFYGCSGLNGALSLPPMAVIGQSTFAYCDKLTGELIIPEGVEEINKFAFARTGGTGGFTKLTLPSTLKKINVAVFQYQTSIANELILPDGLEHIGDFAFNHCVRIKNTVLNIPSSLKTVGGDYNVSANTGYGSHVFYDSFKNVTAFNADGDYFTSVDGVLYSADKTRLVAYPPAKADTAFTIPEGVVQIDEMALAYSKITDLTIPDSYEIKESVPQNVVNNMANNLAVSLYHYNAVINVWTKPTNTKYASVNGIVYSEDLKDLWYVPTKKTGIIIVPDGTENIKKGAFYIESASGEAYTGVHFPASVKYIAPANITSFGKRTFSITIDENNPYYTVVNGKIQAIA